MNRLNVIVILIDGGRLDRVKNSSFYQNLKSDFSFKPKAKFDIDFINIRNLNEFKEITI